MIRAEEFNYFNYIKKEELIGSDTGMRYMLKKSGYLMAGLVWNDNNPICSGCYGKNTGLTLWGEKILKALANSTEKAFEAGKKWVNENAEEFDKKYSE